MKARRRFNSGERIALYLAADGRCQCPGCAACGINGCQAELEPGWHADHITPFARTHRTDVADGQALCPPCNLTKGATMPERNLLRWQAAAQADYLGKLQKDYLLVAVPGAGKTFWAMHTARELIKAGRVTKILIVVPTTHVKGQWARTAHELGLDIESDYRNSDGAWPRDADGVAMTYSQMHHERALHRLNVSRRPTLLLLDEVHHLQAAAEWGQAAQEAFDLAAYRIHLSGTPWNKEGYIPWIAYHDGNPCDCPLKKHELDTARPDACYTYQNSLTDGVNCDVFFPKLGGTAEWEFDGQVFRHTFEDDLNERDRARRLRTMIAVPESDFIANTFVTADDELTQIRQGPRQDRAGGLIIARDVDHAEAIADLIRDRLHKPRPVVVVSEKASAAHDLRAFTNGTDRWLVSVRMVSEGVDIPRLRVLIYATNYTSRLFFRQAIGRVIRGPEPPAVVYLPADPLLLKFAAEIREERVDALRHAQEQLELGEYEPPVSTFRPVHGETFADGVVHAEGGVTQAQLDEASNEIRAAGAEPTVEMTTLVAKILQRRGEASPALSSPPSPISPMKSERKEALRRATHKMVTAYCFQVGADYQQFNFNLNKAIGVRRVRDCDEAQLQKRYDLAKEWTSE
jgi:superfamily II DNA or RNA helicase